LTLDFQTRRPAGEEKTQQQAEEGENCGFDNANALVS